MYLRSAIASPSATDPSGTVGVDMAANPLSLGTRKLHSAVNLRFEEGRIKTRPGIRYQPLGVSGQFQGALHYNPSKGLSARPFAAQDSALIVTVAGRLFMAEATHGTLSCGAQPMCGDYDFACKGPVNLFQAENWLIVQNKQSNTFFWEGYNCLTESPGMAGDLEDADPATPTAAKPRLGKCWTTNTFLRFIVLDDATGLPISGATVALSVGGRQDYAGTTDYAGRVTFHPVVKSYDYRVTKDGYNPITPSLVVVGPNSSQTTTVRMGVNADAFIGITARLQYLAEDDPCDAGHVCDAAVFRVLANGVYVGTANLNNLSDGGSRSAEFTFTPEQAAEIAAESEDGNTIQFTFECDPEFEGFDPFAWGGGCHPSVGNFIVTDINDTELYNGCPVGSTVEIDVNPAP